MNNTKNQQNKKLIIKKQKQDWQIHGQTNQKRESSVLTKL